MNRIIAISLLLSLEACSTDQKNAEPNTSVPSAGISNAESHIMLSDNQIRLANITTRKVAKESIGQTMVVNARLVENEEFAQIVSSRAAGRIEKLYIKETGVPVKKGEPIYQIYSETLSTLQKEFLLAYEQFTAFPEKRYESFLNSARKKLLLYGLTESQIKTLAQSRNIPQAVTFYATASGTISEISITEGQYVTEGSRLMKVDDISQLWVEAELYPSETSLAKIGDQIVVRVNDYDNTRANGIVSFMSPEFRMNTQITIMRARVANEALKLKPGMQAQVMFTHSERTALTVPSDAILRDGSGSHVYIQRGHNTFMPQMVKTGLENIDQTEITEGLGEGDTIAVSGAYLLYSEFVLKQGRDPMAAHKH